MVEQAYQNCSVTVQGSSKLLLCPTRHLHDQHNTAENDLQYSQPHNSRRLPISHIRLGLTVSSSQVYPGVLTVLHAVYTLWRVALMLLHTNDTDPTIAETKTPGSAVFHRMYQVTSSHILHTTAHHSHHVHALMHCRPQSAAVTCTALYVRFACNHFKSLQT
jgi:hypothetical protein